MSLLDIRPYNLTDYLLFACTPGNLPGVGNGGFCLKLPGGGEGFQCQNPGVNGGFVYLSILKTIPKDEDKLPNFFSISYTRYAIQIYKICQ